LQVADKGKSVAVGSTPKEGKEGEMKDSTPDSVFEVKIEDTGTKLPLGICKLQVVWER